MSNRPLEILLALTAVAPAAAPTHAAAQTLSAPQAVELTLGKPASQVARAIADKGVTEADFAKTVGGAPTAQDDFDKLMKLAAAQTAFIPVGIRGGSAADLQTAAAEAETISQTTLARLHAVYGPVDANGNPVSAVVAFAGVFGPAMDNADAVFNGIVKNLSREAHKDPSRMPLPKYAAFRQDVNTAASALTIGQRYEEIALTNGTNNNPQIGQQLAQQIGTARPALDAARKILGLRGSVADLNNPAALALNTPRLSIAVAKGIAEAPRVVVKPGC